MRFSDLKTAIIAQFSVENGNRVVPLILGAPGGGKSACAREIAAEILQQHGLPYEPYDSGKGNINTATVVEFNASLRDPVDLLGTPNNHGDYTSWKAPEEMYALRAGTGVKVLILEELTDGSIPMQNGLCRVIYDGHAGSLQLTDKLYLIATGNRTEDKSGANRIIGKLLGRIRRFDFTESLEDFIAWGMRTNKIPTVMTQFLRFKQELLSAYDANSQQNSPTPRNWERAALVPESLGDLLFMESVKGDVGEGAATEYTAFRKIWRELPDIEEVLKKPKTAPVPENLATKYALAGKLARSITKDNFGNALIYADRLPKELCVMVVRDATQFTPDIKRTKDFVTWATKYAEVLS
jgi:hypothetical protein